MTARWLATAAVWFTAATLSAQEPKTFAGLRGKTLFADDFATTIDTKWKAAKGKWEIADGALRVRELKEDNHGAAMRCAIPLENAIVEYQFRFDGAKQTTLSLNATKGHLSRALVTPTSLMVKKDSTDKNKTDKAQVLDTRKLNLKQGEWHTLVVELIGKEIVASVDGKEVAFGKHDGIAQTKANFGLTVAGESMHFRKFRVSEAQPNPAWETTRQTLLDARAKNP